jgi:hypothetical protein
MTAKEVLTVLATHEWHDTDDGKHVVCITCGARHRDKKEPKGHRVSCAFARLVREYAEQARREERAP